jgi:hypothetical protein
MSSQEPVEAAAPRDGESFLDRVEQALADLTEVIVVTAVADLNVTIKPSGKTFDTTIDETALRGNSIVTIVKLLDGDVTTVVAEALRSDAELRAQHAAQVTESLRVIPEHLKTLVEIAKSL